LKKKPALRQRTRLCGRIARREIRDLFSKNMSQTSWK